MLEKAVMTVCAAGKENWKWAPWPRLWLSYQTLHLASAGGNLPQSDPNFPFGVQSLLLFRSTLRQNLSHSVPALISYFILLSSREHLVGCFKAEGLFAELSYTCLQIYQNITSLYFSFSLGFRLKSNEQVPNLTKQSLCQCRVCVPQLSPGCFFPFPSVCAWVGHSLFLSHHRPLRPVRSNIQLCEGPCWCHIVHMGPKTCL